MKVTKAALIAVLTSGTNATQVAASTPGKMKFYLTVTALLGSVHKVSSQNYVQFGTSGYCLDASSNMYPYVSITTGNFWFSETDPQPCINWCVAGSGDKLVGVSVDSRGGSSPNAGICHCQLTDTEGVSGDDYTPDGILNVDHSFTGTGPVGNTCISWPSPTCNTWWAPHFTCFRNEGPAPSASPSNAPSMSLQPSPSQGITSPPSDTPSVYPSEVPSSKPSSLPSDIPSLQPSESPSDQPSAAPSDQPSCTPSQAPTPSPSINLFYPDQTSNGWEAGCFNDGHHPAWMEQNASVWLSSTLNRCCTQHFSWNYDYCMGSGADDTCARAYWYPDWEGANNGCIRDGDEPLYMRQNPTQYFFSTKADCCEEHYGWNLSECMGTASSTSTGKYYPDWLGDDTCKNDGSAPEYMVLNPTMWLHDTLSDCCKANYAWKIKDCMGTTPTESTGKFYPDWSGLKEGCLNDGGEPQYMVSNPSMWMFDTLDECCDRHYKYNEAGCKGTSTSGTEEWYVVWGWGDPAVCVKNCEEGTGTGCGGFAESWDTKYPSQRECCSTRVSYEFKECMAH